MITNNVYFASQFKAMDEGCGIETDILMESAAKAIINRMLSLDLLKGKLCVVCGKGNNGGDGYALACLLKDGGFDVNVLGIDAPSSPLAIKYYELYFSKGGAFSTDMCVIHEADIVVDCIFGFSFNGNLEGKYALIVNAINESHAFVVSADLPSGIIADSDTLPNLCVKADITCTFTAYKLALASYPARMVCGKIFVEDIGIDKSTINRQAPFATVSDCSLLSLLPERKENSHKGTFGTLAALCGNEGMSGAAILACLAALKSGVGLVHLYTDQACAPIVDSRLCETITHTSCNNININALRATALLLGCGCGRAHDSEIKRLLTTTGLPTVLDADGINCVAGDIELYRSVTSSLVVTPHPAEMGRLLGISAEQVNASRISSASSFAKEYGFVTVLKGAATVIASPDGRLCINSTGNNGLAKGGSGDVLAGLIASLLAQGLSCYDAACLGAYLHGAAADILASEKGVYAMLPSELPEVIGQIMYFR